MSVRTEDAAVLVFDTGPLSHFARDGRIRAVLDAGWLEHRELIDDQEISAYALFAERLVVKERNRGAAAVLALASVPAGAAVVDDGAARRAARDHGVACKPTLALLCEAVQQELLTVRLVSALADDLLAGVYRLPSGPGGSEKWAVDQGLLRSGQ